MWKTLTQGGGLLTRTFTLFGKATGAGFWEDKGVRGSPASVPILPGACVDVAGGGASRSFSPLGGGSRKKTENVICVCAWIPSTSRLGFGNSVISILERVFFFFFFFDWWAPGLHAMKTNLLDLMFSLWSALSANATLDGSTGNQLKMLTLPEHTIPIEDANFTWAYPYCADGLPIFRERKLSGSLLVQCCSAPHLLCSSKDCSQERQYAFLSIWLRVYKEKLQASSCSRKTQTSVRISVEL